MGGRGIAIIDAGLVTSVGLSAAASCAAVRAALTNPTETRFLGSDGEWIIGHQVALEKSWRGRAKMVRMLTAAMYECMSPLTGAARDGVPLLLCVAESNRPGRLEGLNEQLFGELEAALGLKFHRTLSSVVPMGRVSALVALSEARAIVQQQGLKHVLIAAVDSLFSGPTLTALDSNLRLLNRMNSNGFLPGEAAGALLVGAPSGGSLLTCEGLGHAVESATIDNGEPLTAKGLTEAIKLALADAECEMHDLDFRITDNSGEQFYFKEASLALSRTLHRRKEAFDIWHPSDCIGEVGSAIGVVSIAVALQACKKAYAPGPGIVVHAGNDDGRRSAAVLRFAGPFNG
jgi:3-oxoacyl-[acyl-carrier-protein] synthase-1